MMSVCKTLFRSAAPVALVTAAVGLQPALAQQPAAQQPGGQQAPTQANMTVGAKVSDANGGEVGSISKVDGQFVVVKTDKHEVRLPVTSFTAHNGGFLFGMTRDQLNAEVEKTLAAANAKIVAGASVTGSQGGNVGTIEAIDDQFVTVKLVSGKKVRLPRVAVAPGPNGAVIGMTVAELEAAAGAAAPKAEAPKAAKPQ
jgi:preprotein translocase subunit YajC